MMRIARGLVGSIVVTAFLAGPAMAQGYPPGAQTIGVSDSTVVPCEAITVTGSHYVPGITLDVTFDGEVIGTAQVDANGEFSLTVQIPCDATPGTHVLAAGGATTQLTVLAAGGLADGVPGTGGDVGAGIAMMASLIAIGIVALVVTRRRAKVGTCA